MANATAKRRRVRGIDSDIDDLVLNGRKFRANIDQGVLGADLERTIEGASTVTVNVHDPKLDLLSSRLFNFRIDVELDGLWFRLVKVSKTGTDLSLVFEDRAVAFMRKYEGYKKAYRDKTTRA